MIFLKQILAISLILTWVFPNSLPAKQAGFRPAQRATGSSEFKIQVKSPEALPHVVVAGNADLTSLVECKNPSPLKTFSFQGTGGINLNQPANCFSLSVGLSPSLESNLSVKNLQNFSPIVTVLNTQVFLLPPVLTQGAPKQPLPVLPALTLGLLTGLVFVFYRRQRQKFFAYISHVHLVNFNSLMVLRC